MKTIKVKQSVRNGKTVKAHTRVIGGTGYKAPPAIWKTEYKFLGKPITNYHATDSHLQGLKDQMKAHPEQYAGSEFKIHDLRKLPKKRKSPITGEKRALEEMKDRSKNYKAVAQKKKKFNASLTGVGIKGKRKQNYKSSIGGLKSKGTKYC